MALTTHFDDGADPAPSPTELLAAGATLACAELGRLGSRHMRLGAERAAALARGDRPAADAAAARLAAVEAEMSLAVAALGARNAVLANRRAPA